MTKQDMQFEIDQLRKDKIIYALEATATSTTALVAIFTLNNSTSLNLNTVLPVIGYLVCAYWLFCMIGNLQRLIKIQTLEKLLKA